MEDHARTSLIAAQSRRGIVGGLAAGLALPFVSRRAWAQSRQGQARHAYSGCYTTPARNGRGIGICAFHVDSDTGRLQQFQELPLVNPSFLITARGGRLIYAVHGDQDYLTTLARDPENGRVSVIGEAATGGFNGVHAAADPSGHFILVANFASGTVAVMPLREDGTARNPVQLVDLKAAAGAIRLEWNGRLRSEAPHPHQVVFDPTGTFVAVPDKGLDRTFTFRFDAQAGRLGDKPHIARARPGAGSRRLIFSATRPVAWGLNETGSTLNTYRWDALTGELTPAQLVSSTREDHTGDNGAAELALLNERYLYCSNRGSDDIGLFAVADDGLLKPLGWTSSGGRSPRFIGFEPTGRRLYACNEDTDTVVALRIDEATGGLQQAGGSVQTGSPVTLVFAA
ncbi:MAG: lactonase family protein [Parafilimonas terrae]|nr:lactonase family protein [Parafilimonas terrae]